MAKSANNVVAVWSQSDGSHTRIYSNYSTDGGATWHADQLIENNAGFSGGSPQVAMSGLNVVVVWDQQDATSRLRIYSNYSTDGGATWHADQLLEDNIGFDGWFPQVAVSGNNVVAVWYQPVATALRIYTNYSTDGGLPGMPTN
jgi:Neuraminidase (sialidase)